MASLRRLRRAWPFLLVAWLYLATSPYHRGLNNPNEMVRVYMSVAAVDEGTFAIDEVIRRWGMVDDKAKREGRLYSSKAPLQSLVGVPAYVLAKPLLRVSGLPVDARHTTFVLRLLSVATVGIAFAWVLIAWAQRRAVSLGATHAEGTALGLAWALGTMCYPYALNFTGHILAAATAGGCYLGVAALSRTPTDAPQWRRLALGVGALGGLCPFAEYPAALVALPALLGAFTTVSTWRDRGRLLLYFAVGGAIPFGLGLWSHHALWGSPFATGYGFLENPGYVEVHGRGFFGVTAPKPEALFGTLFSPGTGLFFFSPFLALGLLPMLGRTVRGSKPEDASYGRRLAVIAVVGLALELLFISGHRGWRGGWTLGPRYIIPVVILLGFWCVEALASPRLRGPLMSLAALSIVLTGPAAALYPHLSDVYQHPLRSFLVPSYLRGEMSYGLAHGLGFEGHIANLLHLVPLAGATIYVALAGSREARIRRVLTVAVVAALASATFLAIPEDDPRKARRENRRLWRFWEPEGGPKLDIQVDGSRSRPGRVGSARGSWNRIEVRRLGPDGSIQSCQPRSRPCRYGPQPWQRFAPEPMKMDGRSVPVLFMHPVAGDTVEAKVPVPAGARSAALRYGLADASVEASNPHPVVLRLHQDGEVIAVAQAGEDYGFQSLDLTLTSTAPLTLGITAQRDGARVFGWDVEFYSTP